MEADRVHRQKQMVWGLVARTRTYCDSDSELEQFPSYAYCFDGIECGSPVAVGMIGCKHNKRTFLNGYDAMLEKIQPEMVICFGTPFDEMRGPIVPVDYMASRKGVR